MRRDPALLSPLLLSIPLLLPSSMLFGCDTPVAFPGGVVTPGTGDGNPTTGSSEVALTGQIAPDSTTSAGGVQSAAGISVAAQENGTTFATATSDAQGNFALSATPGDVSLEFTDSTGLDLIGSLTVPEGTSLSFSVTLDGSEAVVGDEILTHAALDCESGSESLDLGTDASLVVQGNGGVCIRAAGDCALDVSGRDVTLQDCTNAVNAAGTSNVSVQSTSGTLAASTSGDAVDAAGTSSVNLSSTADLTLTSTSGSAISATGTAQVSVASPTLCTLTGLTTAIDAQGGASVDTAGCRTLDASP